MSEIQKKPSVQRTPVPPPEERLLLRFSWCCKQYRENTDGNAFPSAGQPTAWLVGEVKDMINVFSGTRFVQGLLMLGATAFPPAP